MPITTKEVEVASKRLNNNRAAGPDKIPAELFKYAPVSFYSFLAQLFNEIIRTGDHASIGEGLLIPLQKPGKPKGPASSLRPIVLLNVIRKVLSLIVLARIQSKVNEFVSPCQSGFRPKRSTADVIWSHRWLAARCQRYQQQIHILGIDLSKAFDTVNRSKLMAVLGTFLNTDEVRIIQMLLTNTNLRTRIGQHIGDVFSTTTGTPQGDSLSPVLFIVYLEAAMRCR